MSDRDWTVYHKKLVPRTVASFPDLTVSDPPKFVTFASSDKSEVLRTVTRRGASGNEIHVAESALATVVDGSPCSYVAASQNEYRRYWLVHEPGKVRALVGLLVVAVGTALSSTVSAGKVYPVFIVPDVVLALTLLTASVCSIFGAALTFYGVYSSDQS